MAIIPEEINVPSLNFFIRSCKTHKTELFSLHYHYHSQCTMFICNKSQTTGDWLWIVVAVNRQLHVPVSPEVPWIASQGVQRTENSDSRSAYVCEGGPHSSTSQYILWFYCVQGKYVSFKTFTSVIVHEYGLLGSDTV